MKFLKPANLYREFLKSNEVKSGRLLGVAVHPKHVLLAVSDAENQTALSLSTLFSRRTRIDDLQSLISKYSVFGMVISYPFDREEGFPTAGLKTKSFVDDLTKTGTFEDMNYTFWDDTLRSKVIQQTLKEQSLEQRKLNKLELSPMLFSLLLEPCGAWEILRGYLDFFKENQHHTFEGEHGYPEFVTKKSEAGLPSKEI